MSKEEKVISGKFIEDYLAKRENIALIVLVLDIRHNPTEDDLLMYKYIASTNLPFIVVTNKADKIAVTKVDSAVEKIEEYLGISFSSIIPFSAERKIYTEAACKNIENFLTL